MKTTKLIKYNTNPKTLIRKTIYQLIILIFLVLSFSCETDIPETDNTPPTFIFKITGDGYERSFTHEDNFDAFQLNLRINTDYTFLYSGGDSGGMKQMQLDISDRFSAINYTSTIESPWTETITGWHQIINWNGNRNNPITGNIIQGAFTTGDTPNGGFRPVAFAIYLTDFGGDSRASNSTFGGLNISVADHVTETRNF